MERIKTMFREKNLPLPDEMIAVLHQQVQNTGTGQTEQRAFEAWKSSDLRQLCPSSPNWTSPLQKAIRSTSKTQPGKAAPPEKVTKPLVLQIDSVRDISRPAYQQLQKVIKSFNENTLVSAENDNQPGKPAEHGNRMLLVNFTDGKTDIQGMEYQSVPQLRTDIPPGTKVKLVPPITCRRGTLLLTAQNTQVIGGSVPALEIQNLQKRILATKLNMTEDDLAKLEKANPPFQQNQARAVLAAPRAVPLVRPVLNAPAPQHRPVQNPLAVNRPVPAPPNVRAAAPPPPVYKAPPPNVYGAPPPAAYRAPPPAAVHTNLIPLPLTHTSARPVQVVRPLQLKATPSGMSGPSAGRKSAPVEPKVKLTKVKKRRSSIEIVDLTEDSNGDQSFDMDGDAFLASIPDHWGEDPEADAFLGSINLDELELVEERSASTSAVKKKRTVIVKKTKKS